MRVTSVHRVIVLAIAAVFIASACSSGDGADDPSPSASDRAPVEIVVANYEIVAGGPSRLLVGLITEDGRTVAYGSLQMRFAEDDELNEPWAFLIGDDGRIVARWDNLFVEDELREELDRLPTD
jgi:hypothetical protein